MICLFCERARGLAAARTLEARSLARAGFVFDHSAKNSQRPRSKDSRLALERFSTSLKLYVIDFDCCCLLVDRPDFCVYFIC